MLSQILCMHEKLCNMLVLISCFLPSQVLNGRTNGKFGTAIGAQGVSIKNKYIDSGPYDGGVPIYDINGKEIFTYGSGIKWAVPSGGIQTGAGAGGSSGAIHVIGDFEGCTATNRFNGVDLEKDKSIDVRRQNVVDGCPCEPGFCLHGGTCVFAAPQYCICPPGWGGVRCETIVTKPNPGKPFSKMMNIFSKIYQSCLCTRRYHRSRKRLAIDLVGIKTVQIQDFKSRYRPSNLEV